MEHESHIYRIHLVQEERVTEVREAHEPPPDFTRDRIEYASSMITIMRQERDIILFRLHALDNQIAQTESYLIDLIETARPTTP